MDSTFISHGPAATRTIAARLARRLSLPAVIALRGELGAGKTEFVKGFARAMGIRQTIQSPTFVLHRTYAFRKNNKRAWLDHLDLYRLRTQSDLDGLDLDELLTAPNRIILIEWPAATVKRLPPSTIFIDFLHGSQSHERAIHIVTPNHVTQHT